MKYVLISDTHNRFPELPEGDVLIHAGDATGRGTSGEIRKFAEYIKSQPHKHKIFIPGNHDWLFQREEEYARELMKDSCTVLIDEEYIVDGVKVWGSPWQPAFCNWAFNLYTQDELKNKWSEIPEDTNILVTHGPPYQILDETSRGDFAGCNHLFNRAMKLKKLKLHVFGHIHEGYGQTSFNDVDFVNAAQLNERYENVNKPIVWEYE